MKVVIYADRWYVDMSDMDKLPVKGFDILSAEDSYPEFMDLDSHKSGIIKSYTNVLDLPSREHIVHGLKDMILNISGTWLDEEFMLNYSVIMEQLNNLK